MCGLDQDGWSQIKLHTLRNIVALNDETESVDVESVGEFAWHWWNKVDVNLDVDWLIHTLKWRERKRLEWSQWLADGFLNAQENLAYSLHKANMARNECNTWVGLIHASDLLTSKLLLSTWIDEHSIDD